jgi:cellulose synthase/poly-beta-1,6-N-acetylglucosamine synthase-like glycosyltransferase
VIAAFALAVLIVSAAVVVWIYAGYPLLLVVLERTRPRPRTRAPIEPALSVIIAAHDEAPIIGTKVSNVRASQYPARQIEIVVASDGSTDATAEIASAAGASVVCDLPRVGKLAALNVAVARSSGDVLVFTDADSRFEPRTLAELAANFADPRVGAVAANEVYVRDAGGVPVASGEGLYWRYEQWIKRMEDRIGSAVSASGRLYAIRRDVFTPSQQTASTDDFVISTEAVRAGRRLAFDENARVLVQTPDEGGTELRRKVRVMNRGLRGACTLARDLWPQRLGYVLQLASHKILRRFAGFFLLSAFLATGVLVAARPRNAAYWCLLGLQCVFYVLAMVGAVAQSQHRRVPKPAWVAYYFCLANLAAALAVCSIVRGTRYERWEPGSTRGRSVQPSPNPEVVS